MCVIPVKKARWRKMGAIIDVETAYQHAQAYLYGFTNFERKPVDNYHESKIDPMRPARLLALLGAPQDQYPAIHIAGTKGKGSTAMMCASALRAAGLRVGLYTSPHLRDMRERVRVLTPDDGQGWIPKADFVAIVNTIRPYIPDVPGVTWFELVTAVAFCHFARQQVDIAVVEVGLGGRLDATNVITPLVSVITRLSLDHTSLLGDTLPQIAAEKGGIIKPGVPVVCAPQVAEALTSLQTIARERDAPFNLVGKNWEYTRLSDFTPRGLQQFVVTQSPDKGFIPAGAVLQLSLRGAYQIENAVTALAALAIVSKHFQQMNLQAARLGLATVRWDGRLQTIQQTPDKPLFLVDSAHNPDSAAVLASVLRSEFEYQRLWLIFGAPVDKAIPAMMQILFPLAAGVFVSQAEHPRAAGPDYLAELARDQGFGVTAVSKPIDALTLAFQQAQPGDLICATGSIIFIGDLLKQWDNLQSLL